MKIFCLAFILVSVAPLFSFAQVGENSQITKSATKDAIVPQGAIAPPLSDSTTLKLYTGTYHIGNTITGSTASIVLKNGNQLFLELPGIQGLMLLPQGPRIFSVNDSTNTLIKFIVTNGKAIKFIMRTSAGEYECLKN